MDRLSVVDEMFLRSHRGLGTPIAMQGLWRTAEAVDPAVLGVIHEALTHGPLGRRVVRTRVPGARPRWQPDPTAFPLAYVTDAIATEHLMDWADVQAPNLDPSSGPGWRLSAVRLDDGGTLISLVASHVLSDARGLVLAVDHAMSGKATAAITRTSDWADARRQWGIVLGGTARAIGGLVAHPDRRAALTPVRASHPPRGEIRAQLRTASAILSIPALEWERTAQAQGGSVNSLFVAVVAEILWSSRGLRAPIQVSLPIDTRTGDDVTNAVAMTEVTVAPTDSLADIRTNCRTAYANPMTSPAGFPEELLQVLPRRLAHKLAEGAGERDVLCSNIGTLPTRLTEVGAHRTTGIATRALHPGLTHDHLNRLRTKLSGYLCRVGETQMLSLVSLDPEHVRSSSALRELAIAEFARRGISCQAW